MANSNPKGNQTRSLWSSTVLLVLSAIAAALAVLFLVFMRNASPDAGPGVPPLPYDLAESESYGARMPSAAPHTEIPARKAGVAAPQRAAPPRGEGPPEPLTPTVVMALPPVQPYEQAAAPVLNSTEDVLVQQLDHRGLLSAGSTRIGTYVSSPGRRSKVAVVNFWATWCKPCIAELPEFKQLFASRPEWSDRVAFIAVNTNDEHNLPEHLATFQPSMPAGAVFLLEPEVNSERAGKAMIRDGVAADTNLPITLVTDCRGRVRWAARRGLDAGLLAGALAKTVDELLAEMEDANKCPRCGDGKCTAGERCAAHSCWRDCATECRSNGRCDEFAGEVFPANKECPCALPEGADGGVCALDGVCERKKGEDCANSPKDCACDAKLECRADGGLYKCRTKQKKASKAKKSDL